MCSIRERGSRRHKCGGSVVHPRWVITAAHCVDKGPRSAGPDPIVYCGSHSIHTNNPDQIFNAVEYIHEKWNGNYEDGYDIALLKLDRETDLPIPAYDSRGERLREGLILTALGWGVTETGFPAKTLQVAERLHYASPKKCKGFLGNLVNERIICAGLLNQDTCDGDSGGPLLDPDRPEGNLSAGFEELDFVVGVLSFGDKECKAKVPGVYTAIHYFWDWIQDVIDVHTNRGHKDVPTSERVSVSMTETSQYDSAISKELPNTDETDGSYPVESPAIGPADISILDRLEGFDDTVDDSETKIQSPDPLFIDRKSDIDTVKDVKGRDSRGRFPYLCSIRKAVSDDMPVCDGILFYNRWVITPAHCVDPEIPESAGLDPIVFCGILDFSNPSTNSRFHGRAILQEGWKGTVDGGYDIAMIKLNADVSDWLLAGAFMSSDMSTWDQLDVVSWGLAEFVSLKWQIRPVAVKVLDHSACKESYPKYKEGLMFCALLPPYANSCQVVSGSPASKLHTGRSYDEGDFGKDKVAGIVSYGPSGCEMHAPVVYTNMSYFADWILKIRYDN